MSNSVTSISPKIRGILLMLSGTLFLTAMVALVRYLSTDLHPFVIAFFRNLMGLGMLLPLLLRDGLGSLKTNNMGGMALRSVFHTGGMLLFFLALTLMPLAKLSSLTFTSPLFSCLLAVLLLREKIGINRSVGLIIGFSGVLIILRPGSDLIGIGAVYAILSSISWAGAVVVIKNLSRTNSTVTITIYGLFFLVLFTLVPAMFFWRWPSSEQYLWLIALALAGTVGQLLFTEAMKVADVTLVMPFDFSRILWASLFGVMFFAETPSIWTFVGGGVILAGATYVAYREHAFNSSKYC
jgi:drug/metabolite transporter (DMT)-like permease